MKSTNYRRGAEKERRIVNKFRSLGQIALRSAGSHSPIDVVVIDKEKREIRLIQAKLTNLHSLGKGEREKLLKEMDSFNGIYVVKGELWD